MFKYLVLTIAFIASMPPSAFAGSVSGAKIISVLAAEADAFFITVNLPNVGSPGCAVVPGRWVVRTSTASGKAMIATALSAMALNQTVYIYGKGVCEVWGDTETINYLIVSP